MLCMSWCPLNQHDFDTNSTFRSTFRCANTAVDCYAQNNSPCSFCIKNKHCKSEPMKILHGANVNCRNGGKTVVKRIKQTLNKRPSVCQNIHLDVCFLFICFLSPDPPCKSQKYGVS